MDSTYAQEYRTLYEQHWWWRARERIVLENIRRLHLPPRSRILDFGCGDGLLLPVLAAFGDVQGLEADASLISPDNPFRDRIDTHLLAESSLIHETFDLITALDVLEHIEQDQQILCDLWNMLRPDGRLLITVPASMWLWDRHDEINHHFRRYSKATLMKVVPDRESIEELRYLFHGLFALKLIVRLFNRLRRRPIAQHQCPPHWINAMMAGLLWREYGLLSWMPIPFGTSLLLVLHKRGDCAATDLTQRAAA